ncbi:MAG: BolA family transcriptional regulator [Casimicrobiaceae bacterium]|nr:BolA family transcriptional regulator [Casimicrobiaceae bacterium]
MSKDIRTRTAHRPGREDGIGAQHSDARSTVTHEANANLSLIEEIRARLAPLSPVHLELRDQSHGHVGHASGGGHLSATIVSDQFRGLSPLARHRAVYALVQDLVPHRLHALQLKTLTPEELLKQERL